ncbi:MAG: hypothetical protein KKC21_07125 [Nitrospinae bacterium]|nr:hypothetical protein [Nitrospinota bacterium]
MAKLLIKKGADIDVAIVSLEIKVKQYPNKASYMLALRRLNNLK